MADMTLKELRDQIASLEGGDSRRKAWVAALDAHLAGMGEPVAWLTEDGRVISAKQKSSAICDGGACASSVAPYGLPAYTAPPASGDWGKVRAMVAELRAWSTADQYPDCLETLDDWADSLTAALPENAK